MEPLKIVKHPDPRLRRKCVPIDDLHGVAELSYRMIDALGFYDGAGLAAPQIGSAWRLIVVKVHSQVAARVFVNPVIVSTGGVKSKLTEGCLSLPGVRVTVPRYDMITVSSMSQYGDKSESTFEGFVAHVIQHEIDHLDGKLIIDYQTGQEAIGNKKALKKLEKATA